MIRTLLTTTTVAVLMGTAAMAQVAPAPTDAPATNEAPAAAAPANSDAPATDAAAPAGGAAAPAADGAAAPAGGAVAPADGLDVQGAEETDINEPWDMSQGYVAADTDNLGSRLMGQPVYSSTGDDAEEIGTINDLVFDEGGQITAVVIGVGGFLGIGEKNVAVDFQSLEFTLAADNTERWVLPTTADALTAAPDFVWEEDEPADANNDAMAPADGDAVAPADGGAMAPAAPAAQ